MRSTSVQPGGRSQEACGHRSRAKDAAAKPTVVRGSGGPSQLCLPPKPWDLVLLSSLPSPKRPESLGSESAACPCSTRLRGSPSSGPLC